MAKHLAQRDAGSNPVVPVFMEKLHLSTGAGESRRSGDIKRCIGVGVSIMWCVAMLT